MLLGAPRGGEGGGHIMTSWLDLFQQEKNKKQKNKKGYLCDFFPENMKASVFITHSSLLLNVRVMPSWLEKTLWQLCESAGLCSTLSESLRRLRLFSLWTAEGNAKQSALCLPIWATGHRLDASQRTPGTTRSCRPADVEVNTAVVMDRDAGTFGIYFFFFFFAFKKIASC